MQYIHFDDVLEKMCNIVEKGIKREKKAFHSMRV